MKSEKHDSRFISNYFSKSKPNELLEVDRAITTAFDGVNNSES